MPRKNKEHNIKGDWIDWDELLESKQLDFILNREQLEYILKNVGNDIDKDGFIIESDDGERVESIDSDDIRLSEIGALLPGSKVFIKKNVASFSQYLFDSA